MNPDTDVNKKVLNYKLVRVEMSETPLSRNEPNSTL